MDFKRSKMYFKDFSIALFLIVFLVSSSQIDIKKSFIVLQPTKNNFGDVIFQIVFNCKFWNGARFVTFFDWLDL